MEYVNMDRKLVTASYRLTSNDEIKAAENIFKNELSVINQDRVKRDKFVRALGVLFPDMPVVREHDAYENSTEDDPLYLGNFYSRVGGLEKGVTVGVGFSFNARNERIRTGNLYVFKNQGDLIKTSIDVQTCFDYGQHTFGRLLWDYSYSIIDDVVAVLGRDHVPCLEGPQQSNILSDSGQRHHFIAQVTYQKEIAALYSRAREILKEESEKEGGWSLSDWALVREDLNHKHPLRRKEAEREYQRQFEKMLLDV